MIRTVKARTGLQARVWLAELPQLEYQPAEVVYRDLKTNGEPRPSVRQAAVELAVPVGGRVLYGILGATLSPTPGDMICVRVLKSIDIDVMVPWSLASRVDSVYIGLPDEYSAGVLEGASPNATILGPGTLTFNRAAHGLVGSSHAFFKRLATIVVDLLDCQMERASDDELIQFLRRP